MKFYLLLIFFCSLCFAMEQTNESPFVWNESIMRDLREIILNYLPEKGKMFKNIIEKNKITLPYNHTYNFSSNDKFYITLTNNQDELSIYEVKTGTKIKSLPFPSQGINCKNIFIDDTATWIAIQEQNRIIALEIDNDGISHKVIQINSEQITFNEDKLVISTKQTATQLCDLGINVDTKIGDETIISCILHFEKKNNKYTIRPIININENNYFFPSVTLNKVDPIYTLFDSIKGCISHSKMNGKFIFANKLKIKDQNASAHYDPTTKTFAVFTKDKITFIDEGIDYGPVSLNNYYKPIFGSVIHNKKINYGFAKLNNSLDFIQNIIDVDKKEMSYKAISFDTSNQQWGDLDFVGNYCVSQNNETVELYPKEVFLFLLKRLGNVQDVSAKNPVLNDAQSFLLLSLENAAQENKPVELKEIMKSAYNTMPYQIRKLYEHLVIK